MFFLFQAIFCQIWRNQLQLATVGDIQGSISFNSFNACWVLSIPSLGVFFQFWYNICLVVCGCRKAPVVVLLCFSLCGENWRCYLAPVRFLFLVLWRTGGATWYRFVFFLLWLLWWCRKVPGLCPVLAVVLSILFLISICIFVAVFYFRIVMCRFYYFSFYFSL